MRASTARKLTQRESKARKLRRTAVRSSRVPEAARQRSEEHTSELQSQSNLVCRLLLEKKNVHRTSTGQHARQRLNAGRGGGGAPAAILQRPGGKTASGVSLRYLSCISSSTGGARNAYE